MAQAIAEKEVIEHYGPYGSQLPENYSMQKATGEQVKEVHIRHGSIVDAIGFVAQKPNGSTYTKIAGGNGGSLSKVVLPADEFVTRISGTYGENKLGKNEVVIGRVKIHTNLNPNGYGPYGHANDLAKAQTFTSPERTDGPVIGFFGRSNRFVESVGVTIKRVPLLRSE